MKTRIQYYTYDKINDRFNIKPSGTATLHQIIESIRSPKESIRATIDSIRATTDNSVQSELKKQLPAFMFQSVSNGISRGGKEVIGYTGLTVLDFDIKDSNLELATQAKEYLFNKYTQIIAAFISPRYGVKAIMKVAKQVDARGYGKIYSAITKEFLQYSSFDAAYKNRVQICYTSYDENILVREDAIEWLAKKEIESPRKEGFFNEKQTNFKSEYKSGYGYLQRHHFKRAKSIVTGILKSITNKGYPKVQEACIKAGGYAKHYNLDGNDMVHHIKSLILKHNYLQKDLKKYIGMVDYHVDIGMNQPVIFPD